MSKAAEKLFVGQSTMDHSLNRLRQTLDDPILVITTKGMSTTTSTEALIIPIRKALLEIESTASNRPETVQHQFAIVATYYNEFILLPSLI